MRRLAVVAVLLVACGAASAACTTNLGLGQSLRLAYHKGDVYKYSFHSTANETINTAPVTFDITASHRYTVISVASGTADISLALTNLVIKKTVDNITQPVFGSPEPTVEIKVAPDGRILSVNGNSAQPGVLWAVLPDTSVKPGDRWSKDYDTTNLGGLGGSHLRTKSTYLRVETFQGASSAVVKTEVEATVDVSRLPTPANIVGGNRTIAFKGTETYDVTSWIDLSAHRLLKSHVTSKSELTMTFDPPYSTANGGAGLTPTKAIVTIDLIPA
ncbi:MAG TPA: hypothetical protein VGU71_19955 [Candidatus Dormibacteraeota bacterium]|nr:hypothetical protein [Candidatus Dormibacteraeota bacterium]